MGSFNVERDFMEQAAKLEAGVQKRLQAATALALNDTAFTAREYVQNEMKKIFRDPEPITLRSVLVKKADSSQSIKDMAAEVYIVDYLGGGIAPAKYLYTQEAGGLRRQKRSERILSAAGVLGASQFTTPGAAAPFDSHGQLSGGGIQRVLSRIKAFGEVGFTSNANAKTTKRLKKRGVIVHQKTGTDYFVAKSKSGGYMGIFQLVSKGKIKAVLWFDRKAPSYTPRFPFQALVGKAVARTLPFNLARALERVMKVQI